MPIGTVLVDERIGSDLEAHFVPLCIIGHGYTHSNHPVAATVAVEMLKIYEKMDTPAHRTGPDLALDHQRRP